MNIAEAIEYFLNAQFNLNTRKAYFRALNKLVAGDEPVIDPKTNLQDILNADPESLGKRIRALWPENRHAEFRQHLQNVFLTFRKFWKHCGLKIRRDSTGVIKPISKPRTRRIGRHNPDPRRAPFSQEEFERFVGELRKLDVKYYLIASIEWDVNNFLSDVGGYISRESILNITSKDLFKITSNDLSEEVEVIELYSDTIEATLYESFKISKTVFEEIQSYAKSRTGLIFFNRSGEPLLRTHVANIFRKAASRAGIDRPVNLRPEVIKLKGKVT